MFDRSIWSVNSVGSLCRKLICKYCYANADKALVRANMKKHNPESPFLIGESMPGDVIHEAIQKSWIDRQLRFDYFY